MAARRTPIRVAVLWLGQVSEDTAGRTYLSAVLGPLASESDLKVDVHLADRGFLVPAGCSVVWHDVPPWLGPVGRVLMEPVVAARDLRDYDVLLAPFANVPRTWRGPSVAVAHNVLAFGERLREEIGVIRSWYRPRSLGASLTRATRTLVVSEYLRRLLLERFAIDPASIAVVPLGGPSELVGQATGERAHRGDAPQVIVASALYPYKRIDQAIEAFAAAFGDLPGARLLIAGPGGPAERERLKAVAVEQGVASRTEFLGNVPHKRLLELYETSDVLLHLSEIESFGLVVLEAMARSLPVIAKPLMGLPEVGGVGPVWVGPDASIAEIARSLREIVIDKSLREEHILAGRAQARLFTWERTAALTAEALRASVGTADQN